MPRSGRRQPRWRKLLLTFAAVSIFLVATGGPMAQHSLASTGSVQATEEAPNNQWCVIDGLYMPNACPSSQAAFSVNPAPALINYDETFTVTLKSPPNTALPTTVYPMNSATPPQPIFSSPLNIPPPCCGPPKLISWAPASLTVYYELTAATPPSSAPACPYTTPGYSCQKVSPATVGTIALHHTYIKTGTYMPLAVVTWQATMPYSVVNPDTTPVSYDTLNCVTDPAGVPNYNPTFPNYPSGHAGISPTLFQPNSYYCTPGTYTNATQIPWTPYSVTSNGFQNEPTSPQDNLFPYYLVQAPTLDTTAYSADGGTEVYGPCSQCGGVDSDGASCDNSGGGWTAVEGSESEAGYGFTSSDAYGCFGIKATDTSGNVHWGFRADTDDQSGSATWYNNVTDQGWNQTRTTSSSGTDYWINNIGSQYDSQSVPATVQDSYNTSSTAGNTSQIEYDTYTANYGYAGKTAQTFFPNLALHQSNIDALTNCPDTANLSDPLDWTGNVVGGSLLPACFPNYDLTTTWNFYGAGPKSFPNEQPTNQGPFTNHVRDSTPNDNQSLNWGNQVSYTTASLQPVNAQWGNTSFANNSSSSAWPYACGSDSEPIDNDGFDAPTAEDGGQGPIPYFGGCSGAKVTWTNPGAATQNWAYTTPTYDSTPYYNYATKTDILPTPLIDDMQAPVSYQTCNSNPSVQASDSCTAFWDKYNQLTMLSETLPPPPATWLDGYQMTLTVNQEQPVQAG
jgi:hypothetical protein